MKIDKDTIENFLGSNITKFLATLVTVSFAMGISWSSLQERLKSMPKDIASEIVKQLNDLNKKVDEHIISDKYEKAAINKDIQEIKDRLQNIERKRGGYALNKFIKPVGVVFSSHKPR